MGAENLYARFVIALATIGGREEYTCVDQKHEWSDALGKFGIGGLSTNPLDVERFHGPGVTNTEEGVECVARVGSNVRWQVIPNHFHSKLLGRRAAPSCHGLEPMRQVVG